MARIFGILLRIALAVFFIVITLAAAACMFPRESLTIDSGEVQGDVLVVLGGGDGRAERAAELYRQGVASHVLVTGYGDCASNIQRLEQNGVPASVITPEPNALSTLENAQLSVPLLRKMGAHRVIIVTSWFHSRRALACFRHIAPDLVFFSRPSYLEYQPKVPTRAGFSDHVNIEYLKILDYWFAHGICPF